VISGDVPFYEVVHDNPGGRVMAHSVDANRATRSCISVREYKVSGRLDGGQIKLTPVGRPRLLDLKTFCTRDGFDHAISKLTVWRPWSLDTTLNPLVCLESSEVPAIEDVAGGVPVGEDYDSLPLALVPAHINPPHLASILELSRIYNNAIPLIGSPILDTVPQRSIDSLVEQQVLTRTDGDFGDAELHISWDHVTWDTQLIVFDPIPLPSCLRDVREAQQLPKLSLMAGLLAMGFAPERAPAPLASIDHKRFCIRNLFRGKAYFVALLDRSSILVDKAVPQIPHDKPWGFYECLLQLSLEKLGELFAHPNFPRFINDDFLHF
jgi:hypothetical protein